MMTTSHPRRGPKVLFVSGLQVHPTLSGGNLRSFALANALARHGLEVCVHSLVGRKGDYLARRPSSIQPWPEGIPEYVDRGWPGFLAQFGSYALGLPPLWITASLRLAAHSPGEVLLASGLRDKLAWCEVIVADFPFVHPIFSMPSARGRLRVLSTHNLEHALCGGAKGWRRGLRTAVRRIELAAAEACDILVCCCDDDRRFLEAHANVRRSVLVPNGIDPSRFRGIEAHRAPMRQALGITDDVKVFLFTASKYGPNREALDHLVGFARDHARRLVEQGIHILVVGNVAREPFRRAGLTVTGRVDAVEPYFAAADAALNPVSSGAGTNVKMCEFLATRLPILSTPFGARGFVLEDGKTAFLFERDDLAPALSRVRRLFDAHPERLRQMAEDAYAANEGAIDMGSCAQRLVEAISEARPRGEDVPVAAVVSARPPAEWA